MLHVEGSCKCGAVRFAAESHTPYPYLRCYCSICRKTGGGGGYLASINVSFATLKVEGAENIGTFHATLEDENGRPFRSPVGRRFCTKCGSALYARGPDWEDSAAIAASAIDTDLPLPPSVTHMMLGSKANWVVPQIGADDETFPEHPDKTVEEWHRARDIWVE